jgi:ribosomal protein L27
VGKGKDDTLFAKIDGTVVYAKRRGRNYVHVEQPEPNA